MTHRDEVRSELRDALRRVAQAMSELLSRQRMAGRTGESDVLRGLAIDDADAERLLTALVLELDRAPAADAPLRQPALRPRNDEGPLARAGRLFALAPAELDALFACIAVEVDVRFARLVAYLNDHIAQVRPTLGLAATLAGDPAAVLALARGAAVRRGLLLMEGDGPLSCRTLRIADDMLARLCPIDAATPAPPPSPAALDGLVVDASTLARLARWAAELATAPRPLLVAGAHGSGRTTVARAAAAAAGRAVVAMNCAAEAPPALAAAAREALWRDAVLLVRVAAGMSDAQLRGLWEALAAWPVPLALVVESDTLAPACAVAPLPPSIVVLEPPDATRRESLWRRILASEHAGGLPFALDEAQMSELAGRYDFNPGLQARALRRAVAEARDADAAPALDFETLTQACRAVGRAGMSSSAQRLELPYTRADLVLPAALMAELDLASDWLRNRGRVFEQWGFGRRIALGRGMTALFAGDPGTGKTMAAQVLARELGLELFRVDLSRVMSKYIGETERNLARLFDEARASGSLLFFDEADALFGKRSEVKDAHDRYANLEISYLLQRMEEHEGVSLLATNRVGDLDAAFTRRFHFMLDFPRPGPAERRRIWSGMLPQEARQGAAIGFDELADAYEVSGGEIRNAMLSAAFIAASEGAPIALRHVKLGLRRELLKTGRVLDAREWRALAA